MPLTPPAAQSAGEFKAGGSVYSSPAVSGGLVYVGSGEDGHLYALDAATGRQRWKVKTGEMVLLPGRLRGRGLRGERRRYVYALDAATGAQRWKFKAAGLGGAPPRPSPGAWSMSGASDGATLYALDAATGTERWKFKIGRLGVLLPGRLRGRGLCGCDRVGPPKGADAYLYALDAATGAERWKFKTYGDDMVLPGRLRGLGLCGEQ